MQLLIPAALIVACFIVSGSGIASANQLVVSQTRCRSRPAALTRVQAISNPIRGKTRTSKTGFWLSRRDYRSRI
jgi:hypothetical protein